MNPTPKNDGILRIAGGHTLSIDSKKMSLRAVLSSETVDRYGDVILAESFNNKKNFDNYFKGNPIVLWAHNRDCAAPQLPIGKILDPSFTGRDMNGNKSFDGTVQFADGYQFAMDVWKLYEGGYLKTFSVGFRPLTIGKETVMEGQTGLTFKEVDLLENSCVPIPANPAAMAKAYKGGVVAEQFVVEHFFSLTDDVLVRNSDIFVPLNWNYKESINAMRQFQSELRSVDNNSSMNNEQFIGQHQTLGANQLPGYEVRFVHNSVTENSEPTWNSVMKNRSKLPDSAFANQKSRSYPHHFIQNGSGEDSSGRWTNGTMMLHKAGLNAAWAAANGAHTGEKASPKVIAHLQDHRDALGMKATDTSKDFTKEELFDLFPREMNRLTMKAEKKKARIDLIRQIVTESTEKEEYHCHYCENKSEVIMSQFPEKSCGSGESAFSYSNVECKHCGATAEQCLELVQLEVQASAKS